MFYPVIFRDFFWGFDFFFYGGLTVIKSQRKSNIILLYPDSQWYKRDLMESLIEVDDPTGIVEVRKDGVDGNMPVYNLQGQRVTPAAKGLLIRGGRKYLNNR